MRRLASWGVILATFMRLLFGVGVFGSVAAIEPLQLSEQDLDAGRADAVPKRLAIAAEVDDAFLAHLGQMLRGDARGARRKLTAPLLLMPSIQVNIRAGHLPPADANGVQYLKIPVRLVA